MTDLTLFGQSPFDSIRREDEHGEHWSARDLMSVMGYAQWRDFANVIEKAANALAIIQGSASANANFAERRKISATKSGSDYRLTRFGAYLTAMAGDDTKRVVAEARIYFAVKTREAEVSKPVREMDELEVAEKYVAALRAKRALELQVAEQAPKVEAFDTYMDADNHLGMGAVANQLGIGRNTMMRKLREAGVLQKDNRPYQQHAHHFKVVAQTYEAQNETRATHTTYVKPTGVELIRRVLSGGKGLLAITGGVA